MIIKVFVVITGLALAQLNQSGAGVSIDFPKTKDFLVPGDNDLQNAEEAWIDDHEIHARIWKSSEESLKFTDELTVTLPGQNEVDFTAAHYFPNITALNGGAIGGSRTVCRTPAALNKCRALSKPDPNDGTRQLTDLLVARSELFGKWILTAGYTWENETYDNVLAQAKWPLVRFRTPALDPSNSIIHPFAGGRLANTLVFVGEIDTSKIDPATNKTEKVHVQPGGNPLPALLEYGENDLAPSTKCKTYDKNVKKCIIIKLMNHKTNCPSNHCPTPNWARDDADTHFLQLYRLLDAFDPRSDKLKVRPWMPYPVDPEWSDGPPGGGSTPRCYPAVKG